MLCPPSGHQPRPLPFRLAVPDPHFGHSTPQSPVSVAGSFSGGFAPKFDRYAVPLLIPMDVDGSGSSAASLRSIISRSIGSASNSTARCSTGGGPNASGLTARISPTTRIAHESVGHHVWTL